MKKLYISIFLIFFCFLFPFDTLGGELFENISVYINNQVITEDKCDLTLKPNDVIKFVGKYEPNKVIEITAFKETYKQQTNEYGDWMLLFSVPYIEKGNYDIRGKVVENEQDTLLCTTSISNENIKETEESNSKKVSFIPFLFIIPVVIAISIYIFLIIKKKKR